MIYFLLTEDKKYVKIGFTKALSLNRVNSYNLYHPYNYELLLFMVGTQPDEKGLHKKFNQFIKRGEWFYYSDEIKQFISDNIQKDRQAEVPPTKWPSKLSTNPNRTYNRRPDEYTKEETAAIIEYYRLGYPISGIAKKYQRTQKAIIRLVKTKSKVKRTFDSNRKLMIKDPKLINGEF